jgi:peroxiredoxin
MLLRNEPVRHELSLSPSQEAELDAVLETVERPLWRLRDLPPAEREKKGRPLLETFRAEAVEILTARQHVRFEQILMQARGIQCILNPAVGRQLNLTRVQIERTRGILRTLQSDIAALKPADPRRVRQIQTQAEAEVVALLSHSQRRKLLVMMGDGFDLAAVRQRACRAPEFREVTTWINSDPLTLDTMRGQVVIVHFYCFGCINCVRNLPHYKAWREHFSPARVQIVGIHRPETKAEYNIEKVREKAAEAGLTFPIAVDNDSANWDAWANRVWPSVYLVDKQGFVRYWWYGELNWQGTPGERWMRTRITELLNEQPPAPKALARHRTR